MRACAFEDQVLTAALGGHDTDAERAVRAHLEVCGACRELHALVTVLRDDHAASWAEVRVPSAGLVWWKAHLRARQDAAARATRPITIVTALTAACLAGVLASVAGLLAWWLQDAVSLQPAVDALTAAVLPSRAAGAGITGTRLAAWLVVGALVLSTPLLLYVALHEE